MRIGSLRISIHAPAKGATQMHFPFPPDTVHFNPRSREGSDNEILQRRTYRDKFQSTLPRRERQIFTVLVKRCKPNFNPRSREGSDELPGKMRIGSLRISIHAPAKGATDSAHNLRFIHVFQSTLPRRERLFESYGICFRVDISIHAPAKGATYRQ